MSLTAKVNSEICIANYKTASAKSLIYSKPEVALVSAIMENCEVSFLTANILARRGFTPDKATKFLNPSFGESLLNPELLPDIAEATNVLIKTLKKKGKIGILGDYDVDGISSCAILHDFFQAHEVEAVFWIPDREDGYGPSEAAAKFFLEKQIDLLIIVDCGSDAIDFCKNFEKPIIVIDHHQVENTPKNAFVINPHRKEYNWEILSDFQKLCATGLCFLFIWYVLKNSDTLPVEKGKELLFRNLDLVALGTVCDVMELNEINRLFVSKGLGILSKQKRIGLASLIQKTKMQLPFVARDIGFKIGPRLNAAGRIDVSKEAFKLLTTKKIEEANLLADKLETLNLERRTLQENIFQEVISKENEWNNSPIICIASNNWHHGVIGIIAGKLKDQFNKPTIVGSICGDIVKASARSGKGMINLGSLFKQAVLEGIIKSGGGHFQAAGISCNLDQWETFKQWINQKCEGKKWENDSIELDAIIPFSSINDDHIKLAPYGLSHKEPLIMIEDVWIKSYKIFENYIRCIVSQEEKTHVLYAFIQQKDYLKDAILKIAGKFMANFIIKLSENKFMQLEDIVYKN